VLNVNKPSGSSSYDVIRRIKLILGSPPPLGHAGTLDPLASGVLLVLIGDATKVSRFLLNLPKEYVAGVLFGRQTDTDDVTGKTVAELPAGGITAASVRAALGRFQGEIEQVPPAFSALKQDGQPLYRLARKGQEVRPRSRRVRIYAADLLDWQPPVATIRCQVSSGTYIRALARDLGAALGSAATLASLVRTRVGRFTIEDAVAAPALDGPTIRERLTPIEDALPDVPQLAVSTVQAQHLHQGKIVDGPAGLADGIVLARTADRSFLAVVVSNGSKLRTERIIYAK
jgi:tRNA pseudouridine55 synthase